MNAFYESAKCRSCEAEIRWMKTKNGKNIPVDVPSMEDGETARDAVMTAEEFNGDYMIAHFATCPYAEKHRQPRVPLAPPSTDAGVNAKRLNTALAVLEDIVKNPPDGMRAQEIAKAGLSQIRAIR